MKQRTFIISICVIVAIFLGLFFISSCNGNHSKSAKPNSVSQENAPKTVSVKLEDFSFEAAIEKSEKGITTITVLSPKTLEGMEFKYDGKSLSATFLGMKMKLDENSPLVTSIQKLMLNS